ncbi:MAG TPA: class I SAM-dependent methyltransferase [Candidatus Atribacteria bacterium]|nr:class I SAM-dependent methyltransferase [Candidatus Atribacteria bacterium]
MDKEKVKLRNEKETLLIPLYCKYLESQKDSPIIKDEKAIEMVNSIEYDYEQLQIPKQTYVTICLRVKQFDNYVNNFLMAEPDSIVIHLGCGLDNRFKRVDNNAVEWYDLDFPEVIELRKHFYQETERYHFISSPVMELNWLDSINAKNKWVIILAEGLFMYLKEEEVKLLFQSFQNKFSINTIIFDSYSALTAKSIKNHPSIKKTGAVIRWGIDNAKDIESWGNKIYLKEEWYFTQSDEINKLDIGYRILFKLMSLFPMARKAHRILVFQIGDIK